VAWVRGRIGSWHFEIELPEGIESAEAVLQPSPEAAATLAGRSGSLYSVMGIRSIWDGPEVVVPGVRIHQQKLGMVKLSALPPKEAVDYALEKMDPADAVTQQLRRTRDTAAARAALEPRREAGARFALGCLLTAEGKYAAAMERFLEARDLQPAPAVLRQIRQEQRRLCALWLQQAEGGDAVAMTSLGAAYEQGHGVASDAQAAKRWLRLGSNAGNAEAMFRLAALYERMAGAGVDTEQSRQWYREQTLDWYRKSATLGYEPAKKWITAHDR
jgi:tetratricopeptide (TPR) repeat protein